MHIRTRQVLAVRILFLITLLASAFTGLTPTSAWANPARVTTRRVISEARRQQLSALAKDRDRNEKGQFLPKVSVEAINVRAYEKYEARGRVDGHAAEDYLAAKRELQNEKMAANKAKREAAKVAK